MDVDDRALDGLLRELSRAPRGDDDAFLARLRDGAGRKTGRTPRLVAAAAVLLAALGFLLEPPPTARIGFATQACLVPEATTIRLLARDGDRRVLLGEVPIDAQARVPATLPILLQAVGPDGYALWTAPHEIRPAEHQARSSGSGPLLTLDLRDAGTPDYARDVKPILDQHCAGCHAEGDLVSAATVRPFEARHSALVTQTHAPLPAAERRRLALWVDLGAIARP